MPPLKSYLCTAKKGAAVREGCELSTAAVTPEIDNGWIVDVSEEKENSKGTVRLHIVASARRVREAPSPVALVRRRPARP